MAYPFVSHRNFILYQRVVERQGYISTCEAASKHCATGPCVAHCTHITLFIGHIYTPLSCHQATMHLSPMAAFQPWLRQRVGHLSRPFLRLFSHFNFRAFRDHIEEESGTRLVCNMSIKFQSWVLLICRTLISVCFVNQPGKLIIVSHQPVSGGWSLFIINSTIQLDM